MEALKKETSYEKELQSFYNYLNEEREKCFGIQINQNADDCIDFAPFLGHTLNNLGDPFTGKGGHLETFKYERELVWLMAATLGLKPEEAWGYYLSGSSLSNLQAIHIAAKKMGDKVTLVTSNDAHNSIQKAAYITRIKNVVAIDTNELGQIDILRFKAFLQKRTAEEKFIFCFCSGSVSKGAYDEVEKLVAAIKMAGIKQENYYIHLDAALGGLLTPFLPNKPLKLDFSIPEVQSLSVSFHKRLGIPIPGSLFLMRKSILPSQKEVDYIEDYQSFDTTIPGSRDGLSPFITLMKLKKIGLHDGMVERTQDVLEKADWLHWQLNKAGVYTIKNDYSPCVYFEAPPQELLKAYHLPLYKKDGQRFTHIFTMEHVEKEQLKVFLKAFIK